MKRLPVFLLLVFLVLNLPALAQQSSQPTREELLKMFDVLRVRQQTENVMKATLTQMKQQIESDIQKRYPNLSSESRDKLEASFNDAIKLYPVSEMLDDLIPVYQKHLEKSDVEAIITFYSSPSGQHFLDKMPQMTAEAMQTMMGKIQARSAEYANKIQRQAEELSAPKK